jgi:hypothetical protein
VFASLDEAEAHAASSAPADDGDTVVVVVRLNTVHDGNHLQLLRVLAQVGARGAIVLYGYGAPPALDTMRAAGMVVRREPVAAPDFAQLIRSMVYLGADDDPQRRPAPSSRGAAIRTTRWPRWPRPPPTCCANARATSPS